MHSLAEAAAHFAAVAAEMTVLKREALEEGCKIIEAESKRVIGTYEYGWTPLKPETVARKANGDTPLLETGEMRDSIEHTVQSDAGYVGSNNMKAVWQEMGTVHIPARSFLMGAAVHKAPEIAKETGRKFAALVMA